MDWDQRFSIDDSIFCKEPTQALLKLEKYLVPEVKTLVITDREGGNSAYLASKGFKVVT